MSDLHVDHYNTKVKGLLDHLQTLCLDGEVCVLAGDIADGRFPDQYQELFEGLRKWYSNVIIVTGNHDYYKAGLAHAHYSITCAITRLGDIGGVHFLNRGSVVIGGQTFHGGTMWYRHRPDNIAYEHWMNDGHYIPDFKTWVYDENQLFEHYLNGKCAPGDIVITHHLPSMASVPPRFKRSETNRFFVCNMEDFIEFRRPRLWLHGHTHDFVDYNLHDTRVICNPRGYPREMSHGPTGYKPLVVEI